jgi:hypothetical protein
MTIRMKRRSIKKKRTMRMRRGRRQQNNRALSYRALSYRALSKRSLRTTHRHPKRKHTRRKMIHGGSEGKIVFPLTNQPRGFALSDPKMPAFTNPIQDMRTANAAQNNAVNTLSGGSGPAAAPLVVVPQFPGSHNATVNTSIVNIAKLFDQNQANAAGDAAVKDWARIPK